MLKSNAKGRFDWLNIVDLFVFDRGFHDAVEIITDFGFQCEMPTFLNKKMKQHTTEVANSPKLVTKLRWVVEFANSRLKRRRILLLLIHSYHSLETL